MYFLTKQKSRLLVLGLCLGFGIIQKIEKALAGNFNVNPVQIFLSSKVSSQLITVKNNSDEPSRFQVSSYSWSQNASGGMQLNDTKDIVVFPSLFILKPGEQRLMRVGTLTPVAPIEKTYRIFVTELPPEQKPNQPQVIRVLTKLGLPIFIQPSQQVIDGRLSEMVVRNGKLSFQVKNTGNVHFTAQTVRVQGVGEADKSVFDLQRQGWYVLAGTSRSYDLEIPQKECSQTKALVIEVKTEKKTFQQRVEMPANACLKKEPGAGR